MKSIRLSFLLLACCDFVAGFIVAAPIRGYGRHSLKLSVKDKKVVDNDFSANLKTKLIEIPWFAAEALGKIFKTNSNDAKSAPSSIAIDLSRPPSTLSETLRRIKLDNDREYFLSGQVDTLIYDDNCEFSDPFVSFKGRDRFVENLANLGSFITKYSAKEIIYEVDQNSVVTKFMVKLELNLPWRPVLAWPWGVRCVIDPERNLIVTHQETWDIEPLEGVKQIFRKPTAQV